jgi:uncharacterized membrane-anchored protein YhcB (DUF1043 family)
MAAMNATAAYFVGIAIGAVIALIGQALWQAADKAEQKKLQKQAAIRRYRLEQRIHQRDQND